MKEEIQTESIPSKEQINLTGGSLRFPNSKSIKIDEIIFTQGFVPYCDISKCGGECCDSGVYIDTGFIDKILKHESDITDLMHDGMLRDSSDWFEDETITDTDFPSGRAKSTCVYSTGGKERCVFKNKDEYCILQILSVRKNYHKWKLKPNYCIFYPLTIENNTLTYDTEHSKNLDYCGLHKTENHTNTVFEAMREEIRYVIGEEGYNLINEYYTKNYKKK
ncbi:MAG: DUF3109 family protein [Ignavibacteria bacterium]|nr:DUF3109 family protein [Ignavibacteria bacterium]